MISVGDIYPRIWFVLVKLSTVLLRIFFKDNYHEVIGKAEKGDFYIFVINDFVKYIFLIK